MVVLRERESPAPRFDTLAWLIMYEEELAILGWRTVFLGGFPPPQHLALAVLDEPIM